MRFVSSPARWIVCFIALPALWALYSLVTDIQAVSMVPAAFVVASLSGLTAYRSARGKKAVVGYFLGTSAMMGVAFGVLVVVVFEIACGDGSTEGVC